jgi:sugar/nucleoside kinase (ribokinase family)
MFFRVDTPHNIKRINLEEIDYNYKIIVISDYNKGFLTESDILEITKKHNCTFLDTKKPIGEWASNSTFIKINDFEFNNSKSNLTSDLTNKIIHTMGGDGCEFKGKQYKVKKVEVKDTCGAGDSFMAALVVNYLKTNDIVDSIKFANDKASKVVTQIGVGII